MRVAARHDVGDGDNAGASAGEDGNRRDEREREGGTARHPGSGRHGFLSGISFRAFSSIFAALLLVHSSRSEWRHKHLRRAVSGGVQSLHQWHGTACPSSRSSKEAWASDARAQSARVKRLVARWSVWVLPQMQDSRVVSTALFSAGTAIIDTVDKGGARLPPAA